MKKLAALFLCAALAGTVTYWIYLGYRSSEVPEHDAVFEDLQWLRADFDLEREQFETIASLYEKYRPVCEKLCLRVMDAQDRLSRLMRDSHRLTPELREALDAYEEVKQECHRAMLSHVYEVASHMDPGQRERYLARASAHVTMHDPVR